MYNNFFLDFMRISLVLCQNGAKEYQTAHIFCGWYYKGIDVYFYVSLEIKNIIFLSWQSKCHFFIQIIYLRLIQLSHELF